MNHARPEGLSKEVQPGRSFQLFFNPGNINNRRYHVRGFVDGKVIMARWSFRWKSWRYEIVSARWFVWNRNEIRKWRKSE